MYSCGNDDNFVKTIEGVEVKTTVHGQQSLMSRFRMKKGSVLPPHSHDDYEQTGYLLTGRIILTIGSDSIEMNPGDSWCIGCGVEHKAEILEDSEALEVFTHPREDYVKLLDPVSKS